MIKYEVIVEDENAILLANLLESLPYVKEVKQADKVASETASASVHDKKEAIRTEESESIGSLDEVFGLWKGRNISLDKIREQQWGRKVI